MTTKKTSKKTTVKKKPVVKKTEPVKTTVATTESDRRTLGDLIMGIPLPPVESVRKFLIFVSLCIAFGLGVYLSPFVKGGFPIRMFWKVPIINKLTVDSPKAIAKEAPNSTDSDRKKRKTITTVYRSVASRIKSNTITTRENAMSALTTETANVSSAPEWSETSSRINRLIEPIEDTASLADKLNEIAEAFEQ